MKEYRIISKYIIMNDKIVKVFIPQETVLRIWKFRFWNNIRDYYNEYGFECLTIESAEEVVINNMKNNIKLENKNILKKQYQYYKKIKEVVKTF